MKKYIIFDLDLTLVDTTCLEEARRKRDWETAISLIPKCHVYEGLEEVFEIIKKNDITTCIVSSAPQKYVEKLVDYFHLPIKHIVSYRDAKRIKPHPEPMLRALEIMGAEPYEAISFGDKYTDIKSSNDANIESVACFWGTESFERQRLIASGYSHAILKPHEILTLIR